MFTFYTSAFILFQCLIRLLKLTILISFAAFLSILVLIILVYCTCMSAFPFNFFSRNLISSTENCNHKHVQNNRLLPEKISQFFLSLQYIHLHICWLKSLFNLSAYTLIYTNLEGIHLFKSHSRYPFSI